MFATQKLGARMLTVDGGEVFVIGDLTLYLTPAGEGLPMNVSDYTLEVGAAQENATAVIGLARTLGAQAWQA